MQKEKENAIEVLKWFASRIVCNTVNIGEILLCFAIERTFFTKHEREYQRAAEKRSS